MNIAILGAGSMGQTHARAFAKLPAVQIVGISSRRLEKAQELAVPFGARATTDDMALLNDPDVDAVSITLPTHLHKKFTIAALRAGKHVLLEKPFALTVAECDAIMREWKKSKRILMVAQVLRFWSEYIALRELLAAGTLGKLRSVTAARLSARPAWATWFRDPKQSGGAVLDLMIHDFDMVNALFGIPQRVWARGQKSRYGTWDSVLATVEYAQGYAVVEGSVMMPDAFPFTMSLHARCDKGSVEFDFRAGGAVIESGGSSSLRVFSENVAVTLEHRGHDAYEAQITYFVDCVERGVAPKPGTPEQARRAVALSNAATKALESGKIVAVKK